MIDLLLLLLYPALLWDSDKLRYWYLTPVAFVAWLADIFVCHTYWAWLTGRPHIGEVTVSHTLERLCFDFQHPYHLQCVALAKAINRADPRHSHIKAVL